MSTEIVNAIVENKCCVKCCPQKSICFSCGKLEITWAGLFSFQIVFSVILHFFDIGSDIFVLFDLHSKNYDYFTACLFIMVLSFLMNSFISFVHSEKNEGKCHRYLCCLMALLQLGIINSTYVSLKNGEQTAGFTYIRLVEALLESCPQSLFQLFVTLKNATTYSFQEISIYYVSIVISLFNVAYALKKYEFDKIKQNSTDKKLYLFSPYGLTIISYRITEVTCGVGLLACVGHIYNGYFIVGTLLYEWLVVALVLEINDIRKNLYNYKCFTRRCFCNNFADLLNNLLNSLVMLPLYPNPYSEVKYRTLEYIIHHLVKLLSHFILSLLIIIYYSTNEIENISHFTISILSILSFMINTITLFYVTKWNITNINGGMKTAKHNRERERYIYLTLPCFPMKEYNEKFLPFRCYKKCCNIKLLKKDSSKDLNENIIESKIENIIETKIETKIENKIENIIDNEKENELVSIENIVL